MREIWSREIKLGTEREREEEGEGEVGVVMEQIVCVVVKSSVCSGK